MFTGLAKLDSVFMFCRVVMEEEQLFRNKATTGFPFTKLN